MVTTIWETRSVFARIFQRASVCRLITVLLCGAIIVSICSGARSKTLTLTEKDDGTTVALSLGDRIVVRLPVTMGTGYSWQFEEGEKEILLLEGKPEQEQPSGAKPGETETQVYRFVTRQKGEASLAFRLVRPWEKGVRPLKTYSVTVRVH